MKIRFNDRYARWVLPKVMDGDPTLMQRLGITHKNVPSEQIVEGDLTRVGHLLFGVKKVWRQDLPPTSLWDALKLIPQQECEIIVWMILTEKFDERGMFLKETLPIPQTEAFQLHWTKEVTKPIGPNGKRTLLRIFSLAEFTSYHDWYEFKPNLPFFERVEFPNHVTWRWWNDLGIMDFETPEIEDLAY